MATIRDVERLAVELGATVEVGDWDIYAYAPKGKVWRSDGIRTILAGYAASYAAGQTWKREAADGLIRRMRLGLDAAPEGTEDDADD